MKVLRTFSLVELLVIMAILSALIALMFPALKKSVSKARVLTCQQHLRGISTAVDFYITDHNDTFPLAYKDDMNLDRIGWTDLINEYDGTPLLSEQQKRAFLTVETIEPVLLYQCPSTSLKEFNNGHVMDYALHRGGDREEDAYKLNQRGVSSLHRWIKNTGVVLREGWSARMFDVASPSSAIGLLEFPRAGVYSKADYPGVAGRFEIRKLRAPVPLLAYGGSQNSLKSVEEAWPHSDPLRFRFEQNYSFLDGSIHYLDYVDTLNDPNILWSTDQEMGQKYWDCFPQISYP